MLHNFQQDLSLKLIASSKECSVRRIFVASSWWSAGGGSETIKKHMLFCQHPPGMTRIQNTSSFQLPTISSSQVLPFFSLQKKAKKKVGDDSIFCEHVWAQKPVAFAAPRFGTQKS